MNGEEAIQYILSTNGVGTKLGLENMVRLTARLGHPEERYPILHVAGTNGKGSTCAYLSACLKAAGLRVGTFTSPYLEVFNERIQMDGVNISNEALGRVTTRVKAVVEALVAEGEAHPTFFEIVTAVALCYFAEQGVDVVVLEVGIGGRFDPTNVVCPAVSVIAPVSYDHMERLGHTLSEIAFEKAGIIKPGRPVVVHPQTREAMAVIHQAAEERQAPLYAVEAGSVEPLSSGLEGQRFHATLAGWGRLENLFIQPCAPYQPLNAATAAEALAVFRDQGHPCVNEAALRAGLAEARWPGRFEYAWAQPLIVLDGGHNQQGAEALCAAVETHLRGRRTLLVTGLLRGRSIDMMAGIQEKIAHLIYATAPNAARAMPAEEVARAFAPFGKPVEVVPVIAEALERAVAQSRAWSAEGIDNAIVVAGSLYIAGEARSCLRTMGMLRA